MPLTQDRLSLLHAEFQREAVPHMNILYNYALHMTGSRDDAEDLLQETFLKAYRFWDKFQKGTNIRAWLFRILKNSFINRYRKESREPDTVEYEKIQNFYASVRSDAADPNDLQQSFFDGLMDDDVTAALESLPADFRTVVILCDIEGLPYEEIAEFVGIPVGTVRSRIHRGRKLLREKLFNYAKKRGFVAAENEHE